MRARSLLIAVLITTVLVPSTAYGWKEEAAKLEGERVVLIQGVSWSFRWADAKPNVWAPVPESYVGKVGTIIGVDTEPHIPKILIELDETGERVSADGFTELGFVSERKLAEELVGRTFWSKGRTYLTAENGDRIVARPASKLMAVRVAWSHGGTQTTALFLQAEDGTEGAWRFGGQIGGCLDRRFHPIPKCRYVWPGDFVYQEDPKSLFPDWSEDIWALITEGIVGIGMDEQMVEVTCGSLPKKGAIVEPEGGVSEVYECHQQRFVMKDGRVTKYLVAE